MSNATLLICNNEKTNVLNDTSFGGLPVKATDQTIVWPQCKTCGSEMQYLGKIKTELGLEMIFMCANNPGLCDEWEAEGGGNAVLIVESSDLDFFNLLTQPYLSEKSSTE